MSPQAIESLWLNTAAVLHHPARHIDPSSTPIRLFAPCPDARQAEGQRGNVDVVMCQPSSPYTEQVRQMTLQRT